jgi:diaminopimelate decarboxylase
MDDVAAPRSGVVMCASYDGSAVEPLAADVLARAARRFGTPAYVYDLPRLDADARAIADAFPEGWLRLYSLKANGLPALSGRLLDAGFGVTAVSAGELALAARAGFPPGMVALEGIGKGAGELRAAVAAVSRGSPLLWLSIESADEARALATLASRAGMGPRSLDVLVRCNPSVQPETHGGLAVGAADSKFGVLPDELAAVVEAGDGVDGPLRWRGLHLHVGSQLGAVDAWRSAIRVGLRLVSLQRAALPDMDTLDMGSGFPVDYGVDGSAPAPGVFASAAAAEVEALPVDARPARLAIEPGRAVVAAAGWLVARVLHVRERDGADGPRRLIVLDTGMTELIRPALYGAEHPLVALTSQGRAVSPDAPVAEVRVDGPICESTDRLGRALLPPLARDDLVAIGVVGAYGSSMASTYNGRPRPPEVGSDGRRLTLLRRRGSVASLP